MSIFNREKVVYDGDRRTELINAVLQHIRFYLDTCYWNRYQQDMISPFDNSGVNYHNDTFTVRAYDWVGDNEKPNFEYKNFKVWWYKYCGRGMYIKTSHPLTVDFFAKMIEDCTKAIRQDFLKRKEEK